MARRPSSPVGGLVAKLKSDIAAASELARALELTDHAWRSLDQGLKTATDDLARLVADLDPVKRPSEMFDPGNPRTIGFFVALAVTAQPRRPLKDLQASYGAGVYALYYRGGFSLYAPISGTETPIYVGQAAPGNEHARTPLEQGKRLAARLNEHRKNITRASTSISIDDFDYRALVVQTGWETAAEDYLIRLFRPIWNKETRIIQGFGKHGDDPTKRSNKVSSWDVLHEGRASAGHGVNPNQKSVEDISTELDTHFAKTPSFSTTESILAGFLNGLRQTELAMELEIDPSADTNEL